jgi:hypothetical protein
MKNTKWIASGFFLVVCGVFVFFVVRDEGPRLRLGFKGLSRDEDTLWAVVTMRNEGSQAAVGGRRRSHGITQSKKSRAAKTLNSFVPGKERIANKETPTMLQGNSLYQKEF